MTGSPVTRLSLGPGLQLLEREGDGLLSAHGSGSGAGLPEVPECVDGGVESRGDQCPAVVPDGLLERFSESASGYFGVALGRHQPRHHSQP